MRPTAKRSNSQQILREDPRFIYPQYGQWIVRSYVNAVGAKIRWRTHSNLCSAASCSAPSYSGIICCHASSRNVSAGKRALRPNVPEACSFSSAYSCVDLPARLRCFTECSGMLHNLRLRLTEQRTHHFPFGSLTQWPNLSQADSIPCLPDPIPERRQLQELS